MRPRLIVSSLLTSLLVAGAAVFADDAHHPQDKKELIAQTAPAKETKPAVDDVLMKQMLERMKTMQEQMDKIQKTSNPGERQKLLLEHMQTMREQMQDMRGMGGGTMMGMGGGMMGGGMMGSGTLRGDTKRGGSPDKRTEMMERRLDMMQLMMEQMIQQEQAQQPPQK
jgi:hypothetical protein